MYMYLCKLFATTLRSRPQAFYYELCIIQTLITVPGRDQDQDQEEILNYVVIGHFIHFIMSKNITLLYNFRFICKKLNRCWNADILKKCGMEIIKDAETYVPC